MVTEETPPNPQTGRAKRRLAAEQTLQSWSSQQQTPCVILRVGGIYGPGRLPLERLRQGMPVLKRELAPPTNRIHADDLARVCHAAAAAPGRCAIYNVCDNETSTMSDYFLAVAERAGLPRPRELDWQQAEAELSPAMLSYLHESRRMDNAKMLRELNVELAYPTLDEGLAACFETEAIQKS
jgi:nucleoside-diphosphate-sugar epimerase